MTAQIMAKSVGEAAASQAALVVYDLYGSWLHGKTLSQRRKCGGCGEESDYD